MSSRPIAIAVIGAGNIGRTLATAWARAGHPVTFGARDPSGPAAALPGRLGIAVGVRSIAEAIGAAEAVLIAVPGDAVGTLVAEYGASLAGRIVIDAANDLAGEQMNSVAAIAERVPTAAVYRAFNSLGWENFAEPRFGDEVADLFYCGPDDETRHTVERLIADVGLRPVRVGDLDSAPIVDSVATLWFALALRQGHGRHLAFRMLT